MRRFLATTILQRRPARTGAASAVHAATRHALVAPLLLAALAPRPALATLWPMLGGAAGHPSASTFLGPDTGALAWRFAADGPVRGGAAVDVDGTAFVGTTKGSVIAVEQGGAERWRVSRLKRIVGVPALGGVAGATRVYAATAPGRLHALDARSGALVWTFDAGSPITTSPVLGGDGTVYVVARKAGVVAVSAAGTRLWSTAVKRLVASTPALAADGTVVVGTSDGRVVALDAGGAVRWERQIPQAKLLGTPVIAPFGRVYVGGKGGLSALDLASGALAWTYPVAKPVAGLALRPDGVLAFGARDERVRALRDDGTAPAVVWTTELGAKIASTPAVDRAGTVFVGTEQKQVHALDAASGALRWSFVAGKAVRSALALGVGGRVLVGAEDRALYAIGETRGGEDCWSGAFVAREGLAPDEADRRLQVLLAACGGPDVDSCRASVHGAVNADRVLAADRILAREFTPAAYLALLRDRTRKLGALARDAGFCAVAAGDQDGDHVADPRDACPATPPLTPTSDDGCTDSSLPEAPSADLLYQYLDRFHVALDPACGVTVPVAPVARFFGAADSGQFPHLDQITLGVDGSDAQASGCGTWYELEAFVTQPNGTLQTFYMVVPRGSGRSIAGYPNTRFYDLRWDSPSPYGDFVRSGAYLFASARLRARATSYRGVRSVWGSMR